MNAKDFADECGTLHHVTPDIGVFNSNKVFCLDKDYLGGVAQLTVETLCLCPVGYDDLSHRSGHIVSHVQRGTFLKVGPTPSLECVHPAAPPEHRGNLTKVGSIYRTFRSKM